MYMKKLVRLRMTNILNFLPCSTNTTSHLVLNATVELLIEVGLIDIGATMAGATGDDSFDGLFHYRNDLDNGCHKCGREIGGNFKS